MTNSLELILYMVRCLDWTANFVKFECILGCVVFVVKNCLKTSEKNWNHRSENRTYVFGKYIDINTYKYLVEIFKWLDAVSVEKSNMFVYYWNIQGMILIIIIIINHAKYCIILIPLPCNFLCFLPEKRLYKSFTLSPVYRGDIIMSGCCLLRCVWSCFLIYVMSWVLPRGHLWEYCQYNYSKLFLYIFFWYFCW